MVMKIPPANTSNQNYLKGAWMLTQREDASPEQLVLERQAFYNGAAAVMRLMQHFSGSGMTETEILILNDMTAEVNAFLDEQ